jgi:LacI family transcriptional regulator
MRRKPVSQNDELFTKHHNRPARHDVHEHTVYSSMPKKLAAGSASPEKKKPGKATRSSDTRVTMTDVALKAGVSQSTVSLVLNGMTGTKLSDDTRAKVIRIASELGYRLPDRRGTTSASRRSKSAGTPVILYLVDEMSTSPHAVLSIDGAKDEAWGQGALVSVFATRSNESVESAVLSTMLANPMVIGVIYSTIFTRTIALPEPLTRVPTVLLNCREADLPANAPPRLSSVEPSEIMGGMVATQHLLDAGHKRIGFINGEPWMDASQDRLKGYRRALSSADIPFDAGLIREGDWHVASGHDCTLSLMKQAQPPTAIFCANDLMALGCLQALQQLGKDVPRQVSVMGYDDQEIARHTYPPLSTLVLPNYEMGRLAVETLLAELAQPTRPKRRLKVDGQLVSRGTVAARRR